MSEICDIEPFLYDATPVPPPVQQTEGETFLPDPGASGAQINEKKIEDYLNRLREGLCADITAIEARLTALEAS